MTAVHPRAGDPHRGTVAVSRTAVRRVEARTLAKGSASLAIEVDVELDGTTVEILAVHTVSPRTPKRQRRRDAELEAVAEWAASRTGPAVVVGDLNVTPWSPVFRQLLRDSGLRDSQRGFGLQPTWPAGAGLLMIPIDHLLHTDDLTVVRRVTGPAYGSEHLSLTVELGRAVSGG